MPVFTVIDHEDFTGTTSSWNKDTIPDSYDHLLLCMSTRASNSGVYTANGKLYINGDDSGTTYSETQLYASATNPDSYQGANLATSLYSYYPTAASCLGSTHSATEVWFPHYSQSDNYKTWISKCIAPNNSTSDSQWIVVTAAGIWENTDAIDELGAAVFGGSFVIDSTFTLYGVTGV